MRKNVVGKPKRSISSSHSASKTIVAKRNKHEEDVEDRVEDFYQTTPKKHLEETSLTLPMICQSSPGAAKRAGSAQGRHADVVDLARFDILAETEHPQNRTTD